MLTNIHGRRWCLGLMATVPIFFRLDTSGLLVGLVAGFLRCFCLHRLILR